jgi:hypothetical protein
VATSSSALISALGSLGTALVITLFVILGTPASDGATPIEMTGAGPWHRLTDVLPAGVAIRALRSAAYFGETRLDVYVLTLAAYAAVATLVLLGLGMRNSSLGYADSENAHTTGSRAEDPFIA